jgi:DNA-binding LytR/AlgR family response regulator
MEDHYVRVHHAAGSELVLMTMRQARHSLGAVRGLQVHRSWWVAERAVEEVLAEGRNLRLRLSNGLLVPVSRSAVAPVRAAGWMDRGPAS